MPRPWLAWRGERMEAWPNLPASSRPPKPYPLLDSPGRRADACRAIASHRVTDQAAACSIWNRAVMSVDVLDNIVSDELLEVSGSDRTRIHGTVVQGFRIGQHDDHLFRALGKSAFNRLRNVNLVSPLFSADGIAMQRIYDWVASRLFLGVTRRQKHEYFAVNGVAL